MSEITRRSLLAGGAALPLAGQIQVTIPKRRLLSSRFNPAALLPSWKPYPTVSEREPWTALPADVRAAIVKEAESTLGTLYAPLPATLFLEYARTGNRSHWEAAQFGRRTHLRHSVLAECVEGKGRFLDDIADGIWAICEETFWGVPAHMGAQKRGVGLPDPAEPIIELFSAETAAQLAWTHYLLGKQLDKVHPLVRERLVGEVDRRMLAVYRARQDFGWMGLNNDKPVNNWNPWINSNVLACALLLETDLARRGQTIAKILTSLDRFLDSYHDDGGCDEGPGYFNRAGASLFESLDLLHSASGGVINYFDLPLVRQIGAYIYKVHIAGDWYVNFADAPATVHPDGSLLYRYGKATGDHDLQAFGAYYFQHAGASFESLGRALPGLFRGAEMRAAEARQPFVRDAWLDGIQVATARRKQGSTDGFYFAALGGHNAESHNHNDVGNFVVYLNGNPVLIDVGVETYTAKTFSSQRYDIWTMQSGFHNLPTINGVMQAAGRQYEARDTHFQSSDTAAEFTAEISAAYPKEAGIAKWQRSVRLDRAANALAVNDRYALRAANGKIEMSLMTPCTVRADGRSAIVLSAGARIAIGAAAPPEIRIEEIPIADSRLKTSWGSMLYRIVLAWTAVPAFGEIKLELTQA
jgi:Heparinase II/III-like protein